MADLCRQAVEDSYNDLQSQIEESRVQHAASMTLFSSKMEEAKKQNNNMSDRVSHVLYTVSQSELCVHLIHVYNNLCDCILH